MANQHSVPRRLAQSGARVRDSKAVRQRYGQVQGAEDSGCIETILYSNRIFAKQKENLLFGAVKS